ncbi:hypothetical protein EVAR_22034_1 [Eumeta japonica]|uniref:Uncharacterized protein n=1 Tax=Eumeta variegata TaxID=151549 RepID=A0A4C1UTU9_EUMVA|nr:hypothetical protein EVAR_22034_1 [Eumeta japonica]
MSYSHNTLTGYRRKEEVSTVEAAVTKSKVKPEAKLRAGAETEIENGIEENLLGPTSKRNSAEVFFSDRPHCNFVAGGTKRRPLCSYFVKNKRAILLACPALASSRPRPGAPVSAPGLEQMNPVQNAGTRTLGGTERK